MAAPTKYTPDEVGDIGDALYEASIRQQVEPDNIGKLVMIDIETGHWVIGTDRIEMARRAREARPNAVLYGIKIGYPATTAIGSTLHPYDADQPAVIALS